MNTFNLLDESISSFFFSVFHFADSATVIVLDSILVILLRIELAWVVDLLLVELLLLLFVLDWEELLLAVAFLLLAL